MVSQRSLRGQVMRPSPWKRLNSVWSKLPARRRGAVVIAIPAACIAVTLAGWIWSRDSAIVAQQQADHTQNILLESNKLLVELLNAETGVRGYVISQNREFLQPYDQSSENIRLELEKLDRQVPDSTLQDQRLQKIAQLANQRMEILEQLVRTTETQTPGSAPSARSQELIYQGKTVMDELRRTVNDFQASEQQLLQQFNQSKDDVREATTILLWAAVVVSIIGTWSAMYLFSNLDNELKQRERLLRESRSMLQAIATHVIDGVIILDEERKIELFNPTAAKFFGYEPLEVKGKRMDMLFADSVLKNYEEDKKGRFIGSQKWKTMGLRKVGSAFPVEISISDLQVEDRLIVIIRDISVFEDAQAKLKARADELVRLTAVLAQTNATLEDRNKELEQFAYVASHDLKAPLRAIANLSEWIEEDLEGQLPSENQHQMRLLRGRVLRMESLINGLLEYSRVGRSQTPVEQVNTHELLSEVLDSLAPPMSFKIEIQANLPTFRAKRLLLRQVFANLIGNAIKHHDRPDGCIQITCQEVGQFYEFAVSDDGHGIAPNYHDRVFIIFQTLEARDRKEGTGIGLSIVKKIVETEGGTIHLESAEGQGATFRFTWLKEPLQPRNSEAQSLVHR